LVTGEKNENEEVGCYYESAEGETMLNAFGKISKGVFFCIWKALPLLVVCCIREPGHA